MHTSPLLRSFLSRRRAPILVACLALLLATAAIAEPLIYQAAGGSDDNGPFTDLYVVDIGTMTAELVLRFATEGEVHAITFCPSGGPDDPIVALGRNLDSVIEVDLTTSTETVLGFLPGDFPGQAVQLGCDEDGTLYFTSQVSEELYSLDLTTCDGASCQSALVGTIETAPGAGDVDVDGADVQFGPDGQLYLLTNASQDGTPDRALFTLDKATAIATLVGPVATDDNNNGLSTVPDGRFIVSSNNNELYEIDPTDASVIPMGPVTVDGEILEVNDGDLASPPVFFESVGICRTAGYWGTHGGDFRGRPNITQAVIDAAGSLAVCGQTIEYTLPIGDLGSALEGLCVRVQGVEQRQLYRQLTAAALNCVVSGADDCDTLVPDYSACNDLCAGSEASFRTGGSLGGGFDRITTDLTMTDCIERIDCFNNGGVFDVVTGECVIGDDNCHERPLCDSPNPDLCFDPEGPASSSHACRDARKNDCTVDGC